MTIFPTQTNASYVIGAPYIEQENDLVIWDAKIYPTTNDDLVHLVKLNNASSNTCTCTTTTNAKNTCVDSKMRFRLISAQDSSVNSIEFTYSMVSFSTPFNDSSSLPPRAVYHENDWSANIIASEFGVANITPDSGFMWSNFYEGLFILFMFSWAYFILLARKIYFGTGNFPVTWTADECHRFLVGADFQSPKSNVSVLTIASVYDDATSAKMLPVNRKNDRFARVLKIISINSMPYKFVSFLQKNQQNSNNLSLIINTNKEKPLSTGDIFVTATYTNNSVTGQIYSEDGAFNRIWNYDQVKYYALIYGIFPDNSTYLFVSAGNDTTPPTFAVVKNWNLISINLDGISRGNSNTKHKKLLIAVTLLKKKRIVIVPQNENTLTLYKSFWFQVKPKFFDDISFVEGGPFLVSLLSISTHCRSPNGNSYSIFSASFQRNSVLASPPQSSSLTSSPRSSVLAFLLPQSLTSLFSRNPMLASSLQNSISLLPSQSQTSSLPTSASSPRNSTLASPPQNLISASSPRSSELVVSSQILTSASSPRSSALASPTPSPTYLFLRNPTVISPPQSQTSALSLQNFALALPSQISISASSPQSSDLVAASQNQTPSPALVSSPPQSQIPVSSPQNSALTSPPQILISASSPRSFDLAAAYSQSQTSVSYPKSSVLVSSPQQSQTSASPPRNTLASLPQNLYSVSSPRSSDLVVVSQNLPSRSLSSALVSLPPKSQTSSPQNSALASPPQNPISASSPQSSALVSSSSSQRTISALSPSPRKECIICAESFDMTQLIQISIDCQHENNICQECVARHIEHELQDKGNTEIRCPDENCRNVMTEDSVKKLSSETIFERYQQLSLVSTLSQIEDFYWCLNPNCNSGQIHYEGDAAPIMTCRFCSKKTCVMHTLPISDGSLNCPQCTTNITETFDNEQVIAQEATAPQRTNLLSSNNISWNFCGK
ncbi:12975_t:CDS:10 [Ambispora gerdemannii]|uniref:RBR-type E3 ubiquitin transferase n=1 Tax=Ambispora gerdemannii TaxID=144530 RepID=A0A9N9F573_9GLOM|nr:12975_t:CDS:10 [Ambispora gerdemannii]